MLVKLINNQTFSVVLLLNMLNFTKHWFYDIDTGYFSLYIEPSTEVNNTISNICLQIICEYKHCVGLLHNVQPWWYEAILLENLLPRCKWSSAGPHFSGCFLRNTDMYCRKRYNIGFLTIETLHHTCFL